MRKSLLPFLAVLMTSSVSAQVQLAGDPENLAGSIQSIRIERAEISNTLSSPLEGPRVLSQVIKYDTRGRVSESIVYKTDGSLYARYVAACDSTGQRNEETYYDAKGSILDRMTYGYDSNGRLSEKVVYKDKRSAERRIVLDYDANGRIAWKSYRGKDGKTDAKVTYAYDISAKAQSGPDQRLMDAGTAAAWAWKFAPMLSGGEPVRIVGQITFNFNL